LPLPLRAQSLFDQILPCLFRSFRGDLHVNGVWSIDVNYTVLSLHL